MTRLAALTIALLLALGSGVQGFCRSFCAPLTAADPETCHDPAAGDGDNVAPANTHACDFPAVPAGIAGTARLQWQVAAVTTLFLTLTPPAFDDAAIATLRESPPGSALAPPLVLRI